MYQFRLGKIGQELESTPRSRCEARRGNPSLSRSKANRTAPIALGIALLEIAIAKAEIKPNAITCDRLLIAAVASSTWNIVKLLNNNDRDRASPSRSYRVRAIVSLLVAGISVAISLSLWAWSLTQTSIANSTLLKFLDLNYEN